MARAKSSVIISNVENNVECGFNVGDLAVYPAHGVGEIIALETKEVGGLSQQFYIMRIADNGMTIMIPTCNIKSVGLRAIIPKDKLANVYAVLSDRDTPLPDNQTWNRRYREYMEKIKTGSLFDIAHVFRDLHLLKLTKDLSFGERKLYDMAYMLLVKEISIAAELAEKAVSIKLETMFADLAQPHESIGDE